MEKPKVVVIGAGVAGLAGARSLAAAGAPVIVLEKSGRIGGRVVTERVDGYIVDGGAQFITNFYTHALALIRQLGLAAELVPIHGQAATLRAGRLYALWPGLDLLTTRLISRRSKLALLRLLPALVRHWPELDVHALHKAQQLDWRSIAACAEAVLTEEALEYLIQPPLSGIVYWEPEHTTQAMLFVLLKAAATMRLYTLRHGLGQLPQAMASGLDVRLHSAVRQVELRPLGGYVVHVESNGKEEQMLADGILCAVPAPAVADLLPWLDERQQAFFAAARYVQSAVFVAGLEGRLPQQFYGLFFPRREVRTLGSVAVESVKAPTKVPTGRDLIQLYPSSQAGASLLEMAEDKALALLLADLRQAGAEYDVAGRVLFSRSFRWPHALPYFDVGHIRRLSNFADGEIETGRVVFAGDYLGGPFIEGAVTSGQAAARRLLEGFQRHERSGR